MAYWTLCAFSASTKHRGRVPMLKNVLCGEKLWCQGFESMFKGLKLKIRATSPCSAMLPSLLVSDHECHCFPVSDNVLWKLSLVLRQEAKLWETVPSLLWHPTKFAVFTKWKPKKWHVTFPELNQQKSHKVIKWPCNRLCSCFNRNPQLETY